uniref:Uncharacterized protein n=1 Tax=Glossina morsitans morsitans TaxID=37546 RepID=A0A1B0GAZ2_GLOMM
MEKKRKFCFIIKLLPGVSYVLPEASLSWPLNFQIIFNEISIPGQYHKCLSKPSLKGPIYLFTFHDEGPVKEASKFYDTTK